MRSMILHACMQASLWMTSAPLSFFSTTSGSAGSSFFRFSFFSASFLRSMSSMYLVLIGSLGVGVGVGVGVEVGGYG